jgi:uncharacterized membrane protein YhaH (DUF805 family)
MRWIVEPFRRCFDYSGRSRRREYWSFALLTFVLMALTALIENRLGLSRVDAAGNRQGGLLMAIAFFLLAIPGLAVSVRRLHDSGRAGWWTALPAAPILFWAVALVGGFNSLALFRVVTIAILLAPLVLLALMCIPGTRGPNRFGPDPKGQDVADTFA